MKKTDLPKAFKPLMAPEDQAAYFPPAQLPPSSHSQSEPRIPKLERQEHQIFENWLLAHHFAFRHSRTDKPTRELSGAPDFTVYSRASSDPINHNLALALAIEFKLPGNKLSPPQLSWASNYGATLHVLHTADAAIKLVSQYFST